MIKLEPLTESMVAGVRRMLELKREADADVRRIEAELCFINGEPGAREEGTAAWLTRAGIIGRLKPALVTQRKVDHGVKEQWKRLESQLASDLLGAEVAVDHGGLGTKISPAKR